MGLPENELTPAQAEYVDYRVLIADDQESITALVYRLVSTRLGCQVCVATNGDQVLKYMAEQPIDVLITDMMMPGTHGTELVEQVKSMQPDTAIIVMTGYSTDFPYVEVIQAGACDFLSKPFAHAELEAKLIRIFRERALIKQWMVAENKYRSLFELSAFGMVLLHDKTHLIVDANHAFRELCGLGASALLNKSILDLFEATDRMRLEQWLAICSRSGGGTMGDLIMTSAEGKQLHVDISTTFIEAENERNVFLSFKDVTGKSEIESRLAEVAQKDELTGLYNKRSFQTRIEWAVENAQNLGTPVSLLLIDLDNFKRCNDTYGHPVGDILLRNVGEVIEKSIRISTQDEGFRCGGDEFTVILHGADAEASNRVAQRMQSQFARLETYGTTMSIGIAVYRDNMPVNTFIRLADEALYKAKDEGKNTIAIA